VLHVDDLVEPGAEKILFSRLVLLAWFGHCHPLDSPPPNQVNHASAHKGIANPNCKKTPTKHHKSCNSKPTILPDQKATSMACG
jgi:hypothetical protein